MPTNYIKSHKTLLVGQKIITSTTVWCLGLFMLLPLVWMISTALKASGREFELPPIWIPRPAHFENFRQVWQSIPFGRLLLNSSLFAVVVTMGQLFTCSTGAYAFARLKFPGRDRLFLIYLATLMIPGIVTLIPLFIILQYLGWIDTYPGLIVPWLFSAYGTFLLRQFFISIPSALEDAAKIDGCGAWGILFNVVLPLSKPALSALAIIAIMGTWREFLWPLIITDSMEMRTLTVGLSVFRGAFASDWNMLMAASCLVMLPLVIIFAFNQRFFIEGIQLSGIKG